MPNGRWALATSLADLLGRKGEVCPAGSERAGTHDYSLLRRLFDEWQEAVDEFWTRPDAEAAYDAHIDEARRRRREQHAARPVS